MKNFLQVNRALVAEKKHLFLNQSFGTVGSPNQTGETLTRENRIGLMSYLRRVAMILCVLVLSIGQMWGAEATVGITTTTVTTSKGGGARTVSGATNLTVTHQLNSGTSGALAEYNTGDQKMYYASSSEVYTKGAYKWNVNTSSTDIVTANNYVGYNVAVASGYKYSLSNLTFQIGASCNMTYKLMIYNSSGTAIYTGSETTVTDYKKTTSTGHSQSIDLSGTAAVQNLTGTFYVRAFLKFSSTSKYLYFPTFTITGNVEATAGPTMGSHYYRGSANDWGATQMYLSTGEMYEYLEASTSTNTFKIATSTSGWDYNDGYIKSGYCMTNISVASDGTNDHNSKITSAPAKYYIIVFKPNTRLNRTSDPVICASSTLPDDSPAGLAATKTIYLKPGTNWKGSNAKFAINYNGHGVTANNEWSPFMTLASCETDVYKVDIPALYSNIIICRINSAAESLTTGDWSQKWNQTADLVIPQGSDYFTVANDAWDGSTTTWSTYSAPATYTISYAANGGGSSMTSETGICPGGSQVLTSNAFTKPSGCASFAHWTANVNVTANGSPVTAGNPIADGATLSSISSNIILTAVWKLATPTIADNENNTFSISGSIGGASYYYTIDGTTPTTSSSLYSSAVDFSAGRAGITAKAIAHKDGYVDSDPASQPCTYHVCSISDCGNATIIFPINAGTSLVNTATNLVNTPSNGGSSALSVPAASSAVTLSTMEFDGSNGKAVAKENVCYTTSLIMSSKLSVHNGASFNTSHYLQFTFSVNEGYTFTPCDIQFVVQPTTYATDFRWEITDGSETYGYGVANGVGTGSDAGATVLTGLTSPSTMETGTYYIRLYPKFKKDNKTNYFRIADNVILKGTTAAAACTAPTAVNVTATVNEVSGYWFYPGDDVVLTATPTGSPAGSPVTYQWKKNGSNVGSNSATLTINDAEASDAGKYTCTISYGACSKTSAEFELKCMQFYLKNSSGGDISNHVLEKVDATHATLSLSLTGGTTYKFRVTDGCNNWYGNSDATGMTSSNCSNWTMPHDADAKMTTNSKSATYTFNFDFSAGLLGSEMKVSVVYPEGNQAEGKVIYWDNSVLNWASAPWYRIGKSDHNNKTQMTLVPGTANLYKVTTTEYNGFEYWHIANNEGQGTDNIFWTKDNSDSGLDITAAMGFEGLPVTADAVTFTPTSSHAMGTSPNNDNCDFYEYGQQNGMKTDRVTITAPTNGTITVSYTDVNNAAQSFTSGNRDLAHTVIITPTATPAEGYTLSGLTVNGVAHTSGSTYTVTANTTIAATFSPIQVSSITVAPSSKTLAVGGSQQLTATASPDNALDKTVTWSTSNGSVATVSSTGLVTAVAAGTATITATANDGSGKTGTCSITVEAAGGGDCTNEYNSPATTTYATKTFLDVSTTNYNTSVSTNYYLTYSAYWMHNTYQTWTWWNSNDAASNKDANAYTYDNATSEGYLAIASSASGNNGCGGKKIHSARRDSIWFTGATSVACLNKGNSSATFTMEVFQVASNGTLSKVGSSYTNATTNITSLVCSSLNASNYYLVKFYATAEKNTYLYQVRFGNACTDAPSCSTPSAPTSPTNGATTSNSQAVSWTANGENTWEVYYSTSYSTPGTDQTPTATVTSATYTFTGLTASTEYHWWVRSVCDASHKSAWVAGSSFTTSAAAAALITWTMKINNSAWGTTATNTTDETNISSIGTSRSGEATGTSSNATVKVTMASAEVTDSSEPSASAKFTFTVASGKKVVPTKVTCKVFNVSSGNRTYKAQISDNSGHVYNSMSTVAVSSEATLTDAEFTFAAGGVLTGNVTVKVYAWKTSGTPTEFRMGQEVKLFGTVESYADVTAPTLVSSSPANSATGVAVSGNIELTFSENVTINDASKFTLSGGAGSLTTASISASGTVVTIPYTGLANSTTYTLATAAEAVKDGSNNMNEALSDISFTTAASDGCAAPGSGSSIYKFETKSSGLGTGNVCAATNTDYLLTTGDGNPLETLTGGTLTARTSNTSHLKYATNAISYANGGGGVLKVHLDCALKTGDVIRYISYSSSNSKYNYLRHTSNSTTSGQLTLAASTTAGTMQTVVVTSDFNNKDDVFIVSGSNTTAISYFEVIRPYTITLDANTNGGKINGENTEVHYALSGEHLTLPRPTKAGERFKGWYDAASGGSVVSRDYAPTGTIRLYAQWEDCSASGTVYKWEVKSGLTNGSLSAGVSGEADIDATTVNYLSTLIGGEATIHNKNNHIKISDNSRFAFDDNAPYIKVDLECPLRTGDKFKSTVYSNTFWVNASTTRANVAELPTGSLQETAVPDALVGKTTLYIWRGSGNGKISYIEVTRSASTSKVTYNGNDNTGGTAPTDATNYAYDAEVTAAAQGTLAKTSYTFGGWNTEDDGTGDDIAAGGTFNIVDNTTLYAKWTQAVTLDGTTNGGSDGSATAVWNATTLTGFTAATSASGMKCTGYFDAAEGGNKILNSDGTYSSSNVTNYVTSGKWSRTDAAPILYAQYESSGSLIWNLGVNTDATSLTTSSKSSAFTEIAVANMTNATVNGVTYSKSKKSNLTGKISTPAYDEGKYVYVTFQVAAGYKFIPSNIKVLVQPVGENEHKAVELKLTDENSHSLVSASATKCDGTLSGKTTTVSLAGDGTFFTGTVTLKIYVYPHASATASSENCYRLGTPITIDGAVETACTMPSFSGLSYEDTEYTPGATASAITVTNPEDVTTYAWKQNETNDRTGTTPAAGTNDEQSYTPTISSEGTMYYWCELSNACGTVKTAAVAITVAADKTATTVTWTNPASTPNYGGGGYTIRATVDDASWNGNAADLTITAPAGIRIYGKTSGTDGSSKKYIEVKFDVQTAFDRTTYADNIPFTVSHAETATYDAIADENDVTYSACAGGGGEGSAFVEVTSAVTTANTGMSNYWEAAGVGRLNKAYNQAMGSSADAQTIEGHSFSYRTGANNSNWMVNPYIAGVTKIRLYFYASAAITSGKLGISKVLYDTEYFSSQGSRSVVYDDVATNADSYAAADKGWIEFTLPEMAANSYCYFSTNTGNLYVYGVELFSGSVGSGGSQTTNLTWSQDVDESDAKKVTKKTTDAYFTITADRADAVTRESLGAITYSSSVPSVATVDPSTGKVSMVAAGTTIIKATLAASGCFKKKEITYKLVVEEDECSIAAGTLTLTEGAESKCKSEYVTLKLTGFESGATLTWYDAATPLSNGDDYTITKTETETTLRTQKAGTYSVMVNKDCDVRSNRITISNKSAEASVSKIIDEWYIKQGRLTPDIALFNAEGATSFTIKDASTDAEVTSIAGCTFELQNNVIYLHGYSTAGVGPTGIESAANETIKVVVTDACGNEASVGNIIIHKQIRTDKHVLAFVVEGKANGGFTEDIPADQTTSVGLYNAIAENFDVQATNIKATDDEKVLKQYYSQFDILCITDYPKTGDKGNVAKQSYVNAIGALIDIRPILTMEAFVAKLSNWAAKGISGTPKSPCPRQYSMDLQCKDHEIFSGTNMVKIGEGDDEMYRVTMVDKSKADYSTYDAETECSKAYKAGDYPALQGFTIGDIGSDMLPLGLIYDDETPLQVGIERQYDMSARLMVLGIQQKAMERLSKDGQTVVINALKYLMKKNEEDIADCSIAFYGGTEGHETDWNTDSNWKGGKKPDKTAREIRILAPVVITGEQSIHAQAPIKIAPNDGGTYNGGADNARGSLTIAAGGALIVDGKIQSVTAPAYNRPRATAPADLILQTSPANQSALIFDNSDGETQATVTVHSEAHYDAEKDKDYWQYLTSPLQETPVTEFFYGVGTYTYRHCEAEGGWVRYGLGTTFQAFDAIGLTQNDKKDFVFYGPLAPTGEWELNLTKVHSGNNLFGNSWTAPIDLKALVNNTDFDSNINLDLAIYNTGSDKKNGGKFDQLEKADDRPGTWHHVPLLLATFEDAGWEGLRVIPAYQAFQLKATGAATLNIDYDKCVRGSESANYNERLRAPRRLGARQTERDIEALRIAVSDANGIAYIYLLEGNQFTEGYDNGWELGYKANSKYGKLYAISPEQGNMMALARPSLEGTMVGFQRGQSNEYTITFNETEGNYYLNDLKTETSTLIQEGESYTFTVEEGEPENRFLITSIPYEKPGIATGVTDLDADAPKVQKIIYNDKLYIIRGGKVFSAEGQLVK